MPTKIAKVHPQGLCPDCTAHAKRRRDRLTSVVHEKIAAPCPICRHPIQRFTGEWPDLLVVCTKCLHVEQPKTLGAHIG